jgi:hypothetical protein
MQICFTSLTWFKWDAYREVCKECGSYKTTKQET